MKRVLSIVLAALMVLSMAVPSAFAATVSSGQVVTAGGWYEAYSTSGAEVFAINTAEDLIAFSQCADTFSGKTVVLTADITLSSSHNWVPKDVFSGTFDGNGFAIKGLTSTTTDTGTVDSQSKPVYTNAGGLVRQLNGTIKNLSILNCTITATANNPHWVGIFAGNATGATLYNCYTNGKLITAKNNAAGMVGHQGGALTISNCHFDGTVEATTSYVGGFVGNQESNALYMMDCLNTGTVKGTGNLAAFSDSVYNGVFLAYRLVNMGKVTYTNGNLAPAIGSTVGSGLSAATAALDASEHFVNGGATRGSASYTDCYSLQGMANTDYYFLRSHSSVNGIGPLPEEAHNAITPERQEALSAVVKTFTEKDYAQMLDVLGSAWTLDSNGKLALSKQVENDNTSVFISTYDQLVAWAQDSSNDEGKTVVLTADIVANSGDAVNFLTQAPSKVWTSKKEFSGTFDGNGHSISGLYGDALVESLLGATVKDLAIRNSVITSNSNAGTFADLAKDSRIEGCYTDAIVRGNSSATNLGGIVGHQGGFLTIVNTWFDGTIDTLGRYVSGFVGNQESQPLVLKDCLNTGLVGAKQNVAGFSDAVYGGVLYATRCVNLGEVRLWAQDGQSYSAGPGITYTVGSSSVKGRAYLTNCYSDAALSTCDTYYLRSGATVNGYASGAQELNTVVTGIQAADQAELYYDFLSFNGSAWRLDNSLGMSMAASQAFTFISNYSQLNAWRSNGSTDAGKVYVLTADITINSGNAADWESAAPAVTWTPKNFAGTFDGNGHTISGLYGNGFINTLYGTVKNLSIKNAFINKANTSGSIANTAEDAMVINCYSNAIVKGTGNNVGGMVGSMNHTHGNSGDPSTRDTLVFQSCQFDGTVLSLNSYVGGFVANQQSNHVVAIDCLNSGNVYGTGHVTGISGAVYNGSFLGIRCVNTGTVALIYGSNDPNGAYKAGDLTGGYRAPITYTVETAGGSAVVFGCKSVSSGISNSWDVRSANGAYGTLNGQTNLSSGDFAGYISTFLPTEERTAGDAMGAAWGDNADGITIRYTPSMEDIQSIGTAEELMAWTQNGSDDAGQIIVLTSDIAVNLGYAKEWKTKAPAKVWAPKTFAGIFEGSGYTVSGLYCANKSNNGFVAILRDGGQVNSLYVKNSYFSGDQVVGGIVGGIAGGDGVTAAVRNCYSNAIIEAQNHSGGIVGHGGSSGVTLTIAGCWNDGPVTLTHTGEITNGTGRYGSGILGNQESCKAIITNCLNSGVITGYRNISGISNAVYNGTLTARNCMNTGKIVITCNPADFGNDDSTEAHATVAVVSGGGTVSLTNCYGMAGVCVVNAFSKSGTSTGSDQSFARGYQYYLLSTLGLNEWGAHWADDSSAVVAPVAFTAKFSSPNGFRFAENGDGTVTLIGYKGSANLLEIPASYEFMPVVAIGAFAFQQINLGQLVIPNTVTRIEANAFRDCSVNSVNIPASVTHLGEEAFYGASNLRSLSIPSSVTEIGEATFYGCTSLESVSLHKDITSVGKNAFHGCSSLESVDLSQLNEIPDGAFADCTSLVSVTVSDGLTRIGDSAFANCSSLVMAALPEGVSEVGSYAFHGCKSLTDVLAAQNVSRLGQGAFKDCDRLSYVVLSDKLTEISDELFYSCDELSYVAVPESVSRIGAYAFAYCTKLERASIPQAVTNLGESAFRSCDSLSSVLIPEGVVSIGAYAFYDDDALESVQLPAGLKLVDSYAFHSCDRLASVSYVGTDAQWELVNVRTGNSLLTGADRNQVEAIPPVSVPPTTAGTPVGAAQVQVMGGEGVVGKTVEVCLQLDQNTALSALKLAVSYDSNVLSLESVSDGAWMNDASFSYGSENPLILVWAGGENANASGTLVTLIFAVSDEAAEGSSAVSVEVLEAANTAGDSVGLRGASGAVTLKKGVPGDVNDDGIISGADSVLLLQYLAEWDVEVNPVGADCNGDGIISGADSVLLLQYLAEWDVVLG